MGRKTASRSPALSPVGDSRADASTPHGCRRHPVILNDPARQGARFAEVAGGKTAECAAIFCCFPFGIVNLVVLAVVRLPASLCRRALRRWILLLHRKKKEKLLASSSSGGGVSPTVGSASDGEFEEFTGKSGTFMIVVGDQWPEPSPSSELIELEKEVWSKFYGSGFWRSPSLREDL